MTATFLSYIVAAEAGALVAVVLLLLIQHGEEQKCRHREHRHG